MSISIRKFFITIATIVCISGVGTGITFAISTRHDNSTTRELVDSVESLATIQDIQRHLSVHRRQSLLSAIRSREERKKSVELSEDDVIASLNNIDFYSTTPVEDELDRQTKAAILAYFNQFKTLREKGIHGAQLYQMLAPFYDEADETIQKLILLNTEQARATQSDVQSQNQFYIYLTGISLAALAVALVFLLLGVRQFLYKPILALN
jgi:hypothetical protein